MVVVSVNSVWAIFSFVLLFSEHCRRTDTNCIHGLFALFHLSSIPESRSSWIKSIGIVEDDL